MVKRKEDLTANNMIKEYGPYVPERSDINKAFPKQEPYYKKYTTDVVTPQVQQDNLLKESLDETIKSQGAIKPPTAQQQSNIFRARVTQASNAGLSNEEIASRIASGLPGEQKQTGTPSGQIGSTPQIDNVQTTTKKLVTGADGKRTAIDVPVQQQGQPVTEGSQEYFDQIQSRETAKQQAEYKTQLDRGVQSYARAQEDIMLQKDAKIQEIDRSRLEAKTQLQRIIEDITLKAQQASDQSQLFAAMGGYGNTTNFVKGIDNISQEAGKAIDRAKRDYSMYNIGLLDQENNILNDFTRNTKRLSEDFNYDFRDLVSETKLQLSDFRDRLSPEKYGIKLSEISLDVAQKVANLRTAYISNLAGEVSTMRDAYDLQQQQVSDLRAQQDTYVNDFVTSGLNRSYDEILAGIQSGDLTPEQGDRALSGMVNATMGRLETQVGGDSAQFFDDVENRILDGEKPGEILSSIVASKEYKALNRSTESKYINVGGKAILKTNPDGTESRLTIPGTTKIGKSPELSNVSNTDTSTVTNTLNSFISNYSKPIQYGQCGEFVNDYLQKMGVNNGGANIFTDPIDKKKQYANTEVPTVGSIAIMDSKFAPEYGHVAIVTKINNDGTINVLESNRDGKEMTSTGIYDIDDVYGFFDPTIKNGEEISTADIIMFNDDVTRRKMTPEDINRVGNAKRRVMSDPNSSVEDVLYWSSAGKAVGELQSKTLIKFTQALGQLGTISKEIKSTSTGPIIGKLRNLNPYDTKAQTLKAMLQGLVPTVARTVYGEVGVLTDNDVRLYAKTLPSLTSTNEINEAITAFTLDILAGGYKNQLKSIAGQGYDVSGLVGEYQSIKQKANEIRQRLGIVDDQITIDTSRFDEYDKAVESIRGTDENGYQVDFYY